MDERQTRGTGPESRWAIGCIIQRSNEAIEALEMVVEILARRVVPRGYLPVRRVPGLESERWRMFNWARQVNPILADTLEAHVRTPLQPGETRSGQSDLPTGLMTTDSAADVALNVEVATEAAGSQDAVAGPSHSPTPPQKNKPPVG